jgi:DNA mismatch repair protein MutL
VWEYGLVQAVEHAFSDHLPGGIFPTAFVFLDVAPEEVDFNIHPAKREARFRNLREVHARLSRTVREFLKAHLGAARERGHVPVSEPDFWGTQGGGQESRSEGGGRGHYGPSPGWAAADRGSGGTPGSGVPGRANGGGTPGSGVPADRGSGGPGWARGGAAPGGRSAGGTESAGSAGFDLKRRFEVPEVVPEEVRYLGQAMRLFLVGENEGGIYLVDQHAGHERILYERLRNSPSVQNLLVPIEMETSPEEDELLEARATELGQAGIRTERREDGRWVLTGVPAVDGVDAERLAENLRELSGVADELERDFYADLACKAAIKDGDVVDFETGARLMREIFHLETPHCPHGRPLWLEISREELFYLIGRTV